MGTDVDTLNMEYLLKTARQVQDKTDVIVPMCRICRFAGRATQFYPVAAHSLVVAELVSAWHPKWSLYALLHDAAEIFTSDIPRPAKPPGMRMVEDALLEEILKVLDIPWVMPPFCKAAIKAADNDAVAAEWLLLGPPDDWTPPTPSQAAIRLTQEMMQFIPTYWLTGEGPADFAERYDRGKKAMKRGG